MTIRKSAIDPFEVNHLCPSITHSSPSFAARVRNCVGIGAGRIRLGHGEGAAEVAREQRMQPAVLLLGRARHREDLGVAGVGSRVAEGQRRDRRGAEDLVHETQTDLSQALAAELRRQVRGPQPPRLDLLLQRRERSPPGHRCPSSCQIASSGQISRRTKSAIQSSCSWKSVSVEKSQLMTGPFGRG